MNEINGLESKSIDIEDLRRLNEELTQTLLEVKQDMRSRVLLSELKVEAVRAGIIDLDCLRLLDLKNIAAENENPGAGLTQVISDLKSQKPWLFQAASSSTPGSAPPAETPSVRRVMEMTDIEYRSARAQLLRQLTS